MDLGCLEISLIDFVGLVICSIDVNFLLWVVGYGMLFLNFCFVRLVICEFFYRVLGGD